MSTQITKKGIFLHNYGAIIFEMCSYPWYVGRKAVCHESNTHIDTNRMRPILVYCAACSQRDE